MWCSLSSSAELLAAKSSSSPPAFFLPFFGFLPVFAGAPLPFCCLAAVPLRAWTGLDGSSSSSIITAANQPRAQLSVFRGGELRTFAIFRIDDPVSRTFDATPERGPLSAHNTLVVLVFLFRLALDVALDLGRQLALGRRRDGRLLCRTFSRDLRAHVAIDEHEVRLGARCQAGGVWLTVLLACSSSTSGPSLLRRVRTSASLVVSAFALDPFALLACLLVDDAGPGAARAVLR